MNVKKEIVNTTMEQLIIEIVYNCIGTKYTEKRIMGIHYFDKGYNEKCDLFIESTRTINNILLVTIYSSNDNLMPASIILDGRDDSKLESNIDKFLIELNALIVEGFVKFDGCIGDGSDVPVESLEYKSYTINDSKHISSNRRINNMECLDDCRDRLYSFIDNDKVSKIIIDMSKIVLDNTVKVSFLIRGEKIQILHKNIVAFDMVKINTDDSNDKGYPIFDIGIAQSNMKNQSSMSKLYKKDKFFKEDVDDLIDQMIDKLDHFNYVLSDSTPLLTGYVTIKNKNKGE